MYLEKLPLVVGPSKVEERQGDDGGRWVPNPGPIPSTQNNVDQRDFLDLQQSCAVLDLPVLLQKNQKYTNRALKTDWDSPPPGMLPQGISMGLGKFMQQCLATASMYS